MHELHKVSGNTPSLCPPCLGGDVKQADATIHWLVQSTTDHPSLALGQPPLALLHEVERARLAGLTHAKRRRDWLLGRWTAKHLLQSMLQHSVGARLPLDTLVIGNDADGAPFASLEVERPDRFAPFGDFAETCQVLPGRLPVSLSISHSGPYALCAVSDLASAFKPVITVGADIEHIEARGPEFVTDFFTAEEITQVQSAAADTRDTLITAIWSAKEAALKALRLGLTIDTRRVTCHMHGRSTLSLEGWAGFTALASGVADNMALAGWWRSMSDYILTLVVKHET